MKNFLIKNKVAVIAIALVICFSLSFSAIAANSNDSENLDEIVLTYLKLKLSQFQESGESMVGMYSMLIEDNFPYFRNNEGYYSALPITTTSDISSADLTASDDITAGDDLIVTGDANIGDVMQYGGVELDWIEGTMTDASTTAFSVANPWGADAFVDRLLLYVENGTTTVHITCGTTTSATGLSSDPSDLLIDDWELATSTAGTATTTAYNMNGLAGGARSTTGGFGAPGTNSEDIILWRSAEYVACFIEEIGTTGGIDSANNIFSGTYKLHSFK